MAQPLPSLATRLEAALQQLEGCVSVPDEALGSGDATAAVHAFCTGVPAWRTADHSTEEAAALCRSAWRSWGRRTVMALGGDMLAESRCLCLTAGPSAVHQSGWPLFWMLWRRGSGCFLKPSAAPFLHGGGSPI